MIKPFQILAVLSLLVACSNGAEPSTYATRLAIPAECPTGGTVLLVDGEPSSTICNGAEGVQGTEGAQGATGAEGVPGTENRLIEDMRLCEWTDGDLEITVYVWLFGNEEDSIGMCRFALGEVLATVEIRDGSCSPTSFLEEDFNVVLDSEWESIAISGSVDASAECLSVL